jgi:GTP-binding protein
MLRRCLVAIVGRPNVGKSTLFNRWTSGHRKALVSAVSGTTRDVAYGRVAWRQSEFALLDTGGIARAQQDATALQADVTRIAEAALREADVVVYVADEASGVHNDDARLARLLRGSNKPVVFCVNKVDAAHAREANVAHDDLFATLVSTNAEQAASLAPWLRLGLGRPVFVSAKHDGGIDVVLDRVTDCVEAFDREAAAAAAASSSAAPVAPDVPAVMSQAPVDKRISIRVAIVGQPNVGKSSLMNSAVGSERSLVSPVPGTTSDPVDSEIVFEGRRITLIDTAGIRRRSAGSESIVERRSALWAMRAIERCHVAILMVDAQPAGGVGDQEQRLAGAIAEKRCSTVIAANKWDLVRGVDGITLASITDEVRRRLKFVPYAPVLPVTAKTGQGVQNLMRTVVRCFDERGYRFSTSQLNRIVRDANLMHKPPSKEGRTLRVAFATQSAQYPPTFVLWCNDPELAHFSYERFVENQLRQHHPFIGTPISLVWRKNAAKPRREPLRDRRETNRSVEFGASKKAK